VSRPVVTALTGPGESDLVTALGATADYTVARRCADLPDLLAAAAAGHGEVALVSPDLRSLDRSALHELPSHGVVVGGVTEPGDELGERRLRQLGLDVVVRTDIPAPDLEDLLDGLVRERRSLAAPTGGGAQADGGAHGSEAGPEDLDVLAAPPAAPGRVIAVWGPAGAPGRSTVALNLAAELAVHGPTLLVDCDTYGSSVAQALGLLDEAPGMAAACRAADQGTFDLLALARLAPEVSPDLRVLTGIPRADRWTELRAASVAQVLEVARQLGAYVVVDCGFCVEDDEELSYDTLAPRRNAATLVALESADDLLVVGAGDPIGLQRLVRAVQDLGSVPSPSSRRVVVNKVRASAVGSRPERRIADALGRFAGMDELSYLPWDQATLDAAMFAGKSLAEYAPASELRRAFVGLTEAYATVEPRYRRRRRR
jgi:MinD-like ATPase involved in chromosome partitioning or flagellar assembly